MGSVVNSSTATIMEEVTSVHNDQTMIELSEYNIGDFMRDIGNALGANETWKNEVSVKRTKSEWDNKIGDLLQIRQKSNVQYQQVDAGTDDTQDDASLIDNRALQSVGDNVVHFDQKS